MANSKVEVVRQNKVLGTYITDDGSPGLDAAVKASTRHLHREVHRRAALSSGDKATLVDSVVLS
eukprot:1583045-Pyramimonas_sp.AAC.1